MNLAVVALLLVFPALVLAFGVVLGRYVNGSRRDEDEQ